MDLWHHSRRRIGLWRGRDSGVTHRQRTGSPVVLADVRNMPDSDTLGLITGPRGTRLISAGMGRGCRWRLSSVFNTGGYPCYNRRPGQCTNSRYLRWFSVNRHLDSAYVLVCDTGWFFRLAVLPAASGPTARTFGNAKKDLVILADTRCRL